MNIILALALTSSLLAAGPENKSHKISPPKLACPKLDLFAALKTRSVACFREALHNMDVNETDKHGDTPLHVAIQLRNKEAIPFLIKRGADLNKTNNRGHSPRALAEEYGYRRLSAYLESIELETERMLAAIDNENLVAVNASLLRGASIGTRNSRQDTPLHKAAQSDLPEIARLLLHYGAEVDARNYLGETPLHSAALRDFSAVMKTLLEAGANPAALNFRRETPLDLAMVRQAPAVMELFKKFKSKRGSREDATFSISGGDGEGSSSTAGSN